MPDEMRVVTLEGDLGHITMVGDPKKEKTSVSVEYRDKCLEFKSWTAARASAVTIMMYAQNIYDAQIMSAHINACKRGIAQGKVLTAITGKVHFTNEYDV